MTTHYHILDVRYDASTDDIKRVYRKLALENHPDKTFSLSTKERDEREAYFKTATAAYEEHG
jgi:DnaJ-class molecular chaperone